MIAEAPQRGRWAGLVFQCFLVFSLAVGVITLIVLFGQVLIDSQGYLDTSLLENPPSALPELAGARPAILASIYLAVLVFGFSVPIGVLTAIYLEEYAQKERWYNRLLELNIQNLAGVPSIVYGILGLAFLVRGIGLGRTLLAGSLILTLLVLPTVIIASREALRSVPPSIRDGAYALGATQWQVTWRQVLPAAIPGIATGSILALSRAIGETAPLLLVGAVTYVRLRPDIDERVHRAPGSDLQLDQAAAGRVQAPRRSRYRGAAGHAPRPQLRGDPASQPLPETMVRWTR